MRTIKFRAWDKKSDAMIYNPLGFPELYPTNELMQYTGLLDKNGKEIYEGDILKGVSANIYSKGVISNYEVMWGIDSWHIKGTGFCLQELFNFCNRNIEIIGNIYEGETK